MSLRWRRVPLGVMMLATLLIVFSGLGRAQLNCNTQKCVEIPYVAQGKTDNRNKNVFMTYVRRVDGNYYVSYAYSDQYAEDNCYGQNSVGGSTVGANKTMGYYIVITNGAGSADCPNNITPVSGTVAPADYTNKSVNDTFPNQCVKP